jgi:hypothetical protein
MLDAEYPLPDSSFTTQDRENLITLHARTSKPARDADIQWEVMDNPDDFVDSRVLHATASGPEVPLQIVPLDPAPTDSGTPRWWATHSCPSPYSRDYCRANHDGVALDHKAISYKVVAYVMEKGERISTDTLVITQSAVDVLRQEYVDFNKPTIPNAADLRHPAHSTHFSVYQLIGSSDYYRIRRTGPLVRNAVSDSLGWIGQQLRTGLENVRTYSGTELTITAGYRNPLHNWVHVGKDQQYAASLTSNHVYGYAADIAANNDRDRFYALSRAGLRAGACMEPPTEYVDPVTHRRGLVRDFDHAHVDFMPNYHCPDNWQRFADSLRRAR